ncbi:MAG: hypothetical protein ABSF71_37630, partial [Terriglobia bacterium]
SPRAPAAMMLKAETAYGDDAVSFSNTGSCSNSFTFKCVPSPIRSSVTKMASMTPGTSTIACCWD